MPIRIIRDDERLTFTYGDARIYYRRIPAHIRRQLFARHTKRGQIDAHGLMLDLLDYAILDWEGVVDEAGQPLPYSRELLGYLPAEVTDALADALNAASPVDPKEAAAQKN